MMFNAINRIIDRLRRRRASRWVEVMANAAGVVVVLDDRAVSPLFRWIDVTEVRTFKRDLGTIDGIRLAFEAGGLWHEFGEDLEGFGRLSDAMSEHIPSIPAGWCADVMHPAFATNERFLCRRDGSAGRDP
jgi:hypothetical protein